MRKQKSLGGLLAVLFVFSSLNASKASVTIGYVANSSTGYFVASDKTTLVNTGEISVGFFTGGGPTATDWQNILGGSVSNAWSSMLALGYTDVRTLGTLGTGYDPSFATGGTPTTNIGATVQNIPFASLPANTRMYVLGFNAGTWDNTAKTATFGLATEFGVVSAFGHSITSQNFLSPADSGTKSIQFKSAALVDTDILIGSLVSSASGTVAMVPEPSVISMLLLGIAYAFRRNKSMKLQSRNNS